MKKVLIILMLLCAASVFADNYDEFAFKIMNAFNIDYVSQEVWEEWQGDSEAFIKYYTENGQCYGE